MHPQRLTVPLFQRPYVWNEENQWEPLESIAAEADEDEGDEDDDEEGGQIQTKSSPLGTCSPS